MYTLLFSRIGLPLVHRYRVFARAGTHVAFRGTYRARLRTFLNAADAVCLRSRNRCRARSLASCACSGAAVHPELLPVTLTAESSASISPGCPYRFTSYTAPAVADTDPAFGIQLHHPRFLEFIRAPESARLLFRSPAFWVQNMDPEDAVAAAVNLQRDAAVMSSNLQILCQFVTSLQRMSSEVLSLAMSQVVFPSSEISCSSCISGGPLYVCYGVVSTSGWPEWTRAFADVIIGNACMNCRTCFPAGPGPSGT